MPPIIPFSASPARFLTWVITWGARAVSSFRYSTPGISRSSLASRAGAIGVPIGAT